MDKKVAVFLPASWAWTWRILSRCLRSNASSYWRRSLHGQWSGQLDRHSSWRHAGQALLLYPLTPMTSTSNHPCLLDDIETCLGVASSVANVPRRTCRCRRRRRLRWCPSPHASSRLQQQQQQQQQQHPTSSTVYTCTCAQQATVLHALNSRSLIRLRVHCV